MKRACFWLQKPLRVGQETGRCRHPVRTEKMPDASAILYVWPEWFPGHWGISPDGRVVGNDELTWPKNIPYENSCDLPTSSVMGQSNEEPLLWLSLDLVCSEASRSWPRGGAETDFFFFGRCATLDVCPHFFTIVIKNVIFSFILFAARSEKVSIFFVGNDKKFVDKLVFGYPITVRSLVLFQKFDEMKRIISLGKMLMLRWELRFLHGTIRNRDPQTLFFPVAKGTKTPWTIEVLTLRRCLSSWIQTGSYLKMGKIAPGLTKFLCCLLGDRSWPISTRWYGQIQRLCLRVCPCACMHRRH